jgi:hypothetical protein
MPQTSSTIAFALILGFIVFVTVRGELPVYLGVIGLGSKQVTPASSGSSSGLPSIGTLANLAMALGS